VPSLVNQLRLWASWGRNIALYRVARARVVPLVAVLGLSACAMDSHTPQALLQGCMPDRLDFVENVEWQGIVPNRIRIIDGNYRPMVMYLEKDRPYILTIENVDASSHNVWAPGLLKQGVALDSIQIGDKAPAKGCVNGVRVLPRSEVTLRFVPVWEGRYELYDMGLPIPGQNADGVFHIIPPRIGVASK